MSELPDALKHTEGRIIYNETYYIETCMNCSHERDVDNNCESPCRCRPVNGNYFIVHRSIETGKLVVSCNVCDQFISSYGSYRTNQSPCKKCYGKPSNSYLKERA